MSKKILILSASTGGGHNRAAKAVAEELQKIGLDYKIVDSLRYVNRLMDTLISKGYEKSALYTPTAYGGIYYASDNRIGRAGLDYNFLMRYMASRLAHLLEVEKPSLVLCTHPFPQIALSHLKEKGRIDMPLYYILTDYTVHTANMAPFVDRYIAGDAYVATMLQDKGVPAEKISATGIPIEKSFLDPVDTQTFKKQHQLQDGFTLLLVGGSFGAGNIVKVFHDLMEIERPFQLVVVCGRNRSLYERLFPYSGAYPGGKRVHVVGFTDQMQHYMSISDCIITKPGGLTVTECILKELPMIIPFYIPGHEKENLDFLLNSGAALKPTNVMKLSTLICTLLDHPEKLERLRASLRSLQKPSPASKIAELIAQEEALGV